MVKKICMVAALVCMTLITACGAKDVSMDPVAVADQLAGGVAFTAQMEALDTDASLALYNLDGSAVASCRVYVSAGGATAEEISVWEAKDASSAKKVEEAVKTRIETQKAGFENYVPQEMEKLNAPVMKASGKYVALCLSNDNGAAKKVLDSYFK